MCHAELQYWGPKFGMILCNAEWQTGLLTFQKAKEKKKKAKKKKKPNKTTTTTKKKIIQTTKQGMYNKKNANITNNRLH